MKLKQWVMVGLAVIIVGTLIAIPIANSNILAGSKVIFEGRYEVSNMKSIINTQNVTNSVTNGQYILYYRQPSYSPTQYGSDLVLYNITDGSEVTIYRWDVNGTAITPLFSDIQGNGVAYVLYNSSKAGYEFWYYNITTKDSRMIITSDPYEPFYGVKIWGDKVVWSEGSGSEWWMYYEDVTTMPDMAGTLDHSAVAQFTNFDIYGNTVVYTSIQGGGSWIKRVSIPTGVAKFVTPIATWNGTATFDFPTIYDDKIAVQVYPKFGGGYNGYFTNITKAEPTLTRVTYPSLQWAYNIIENPTIYGNLIMWYEYDMTYVHTWITLYDIEKNMTWRIYEPAGGLIYGQPQWNSPSMYDGVITWVDFHTFADQTVEWVTIGAFQNTVKQPLFAEAVNLNGVYLIGIAGTILVGIIATELISEGGDGGLFRPHRGEVKIRPEYYEIK